MSINVLFRYVGTGHRYTLPNGLVLKCHKVNFKHLLLSLLNRTGYAEDFHNPWVEIRWAFVSRFQYRIYYVIDGDRIVHTSYCTHKCFKFPFMKNDDWHIGPCHTDDKYQGNNIYPAVLQSICETLKKDSNNIYMIVENTNVASTKGVLKSGFEAVGNLSKSKILKVYMIGEKSK